MLHYLLSPEIRTPDQLLKEIHQQIPGAVPVNIRSLIWGGFPDALKSVDNPVLVGSLGVQECRNDWQKSLGSICYGFFQRIDEGTRRWSSPWIGLLESIQPFDKAPVLGKGEQLLDPIWRWSRARP